MTLPLPEQAPVIQPANESRLDQLCAELAVVTPEFDRIKARYEELRTAIKAELAAQLSEGQKVIMLQSPYLPMMRLRGIPKWRLDTKMLKSKYPHAYVDCAERGTEWRLEKVT